jgi:hypothetical protein
MHERERKVLHETIDPVMEKVKKARDKFVADTDKWRAVISQHEREILDAYDSDMEKLSQKKAGVDRRLADRVRRAHEALDSAGSGPGLHPEEPSQRETRLNPNIDRGAENAVLRTQGSGDAEIVRSLERLSQRERKITKRLDETAQRHQEIENAEHERRLDELSQRESLMVQWHDQRMREAIQRELNVLDEEQAQSIAKLAQLAARKAQLDERMAQLDERKE